MYNRDPLQYYHVLNVSPDADERTLKLNYRDQAKQWHPDYNKSDEAMERFQKISVAYDILHDEERRLTYDLLACAYAADDFPQMDALSILKDRMGEENPDVRVFDLTYVTGSFLKFSRREERLICSEKQAFNEIVKCSLSNWLFGWWGLKAFAANLRALGQNFRRTGNNRSDNLSLLVHNALAYHQEGKETQAARSALQALDYALPQQRPLLQKLIAQLGRSVPAAPRWRLLRLKLAHLLVPLVVLIVLLSPLLNSALGGLGRYMNKQNEITYFQKVQFSDGGETFDDVVVSKVFDIPVDVYDRKMLYHLARDGKVMYGPGTQFDVLASLEQGRTVRLTGFTPDKKWYRIMLDNGEMGFVQARQLKKGIGTPIPENSKISAGPTEGEK